MAKRTATQVVCDLCNRSGAKSWTVRTPEGEQARVDVCPRCSTPLAQAFNAGRRTNHGPIGSQTIDDAIVEDYNGPIGDRSSRASYLRSSPDSPTYMWTVAQEKKSK